MSQYINGVLTLEAAEQQALSGMTAKYDTLLTCAGSHTAAKVAGTYLFGYGDPLAIAGTGTLYPIATIYISSADYPTINGLAPKFRIRGQIYCNAVAPTGNFQLGLYPVTRPGSAGGAGVCIYTAGAAIASTGTLNAPAANSVSQTASADFGIPADGHYALALLTSGTIAISAHLHVTAMLQLRNA
jgi:hypothetical protein